MLIKLCPGHNSLLPVGWQVLNFSGLSSSKAKGGGQAVSECLPGSKPLELGDKSLSQGLSDRNLF